MTSKDEENAILDALLEISTDDPRYLELGKKFPIPPEVALVAKDVYGTDFIRNTGFNFEKVEAKYGKNWLSQ